MCDAPLGSQSNPTMMCNQRESVPIVCSTMTVEEYLSTLGGTTLGHLGHGKYAVSTGTKASIISFTWIFTEKRWKSTLAHTFSYICPAPQHHRKHKNTHMGYGFPVISLTQVEPGGRDWIVLFAVRYMWTPAIADCQLATQRTTI